MKKYNFILRKDNVQLFISRLNALIAISGAALLQSEYTGARKVDGWLKSIGFNRLFEPNPVVKMHPHYLVPMYMEYRVTNKALYIHIGTDSVIDIEYGTKMQLSGTTIRFKEINKWGIHCNKCPKGYVTTISPFSNIDKASDAIEVENEYAKIYWNEVEAEWDNQN